MSINKPDNHDELKKHRSLRARVKKLIKDGEELGEQLAKDQPNLSGVDLLREVASVVRRNYPNATPFEFVHLAAGGKKGYGPAK